MKELFLLIAGVTATVIMTFFIFLIGVISGKGLNVIKLLSIVLFKGKLNSVNKPIKLLTGTILHFMTGIIYAFIFAWAWTIGIGKPNFFFSIIFGICVGLLALFVWNLMISSYSSLLNIPVRIFYTVLFLAHIVFSFVVFYTYLFLERYPLPLDQSINWGLRASF